MRWSLLARCLFACALAGAMSCAALAGINDGPGGSDANDASGDGNSANDGGASAGDALAGGDATGACTPVSASESPSLIHAQHVDGAKPVFIDGKPDEWACVDRLDFSNGQRNVGLATGVGVANIAVQWDEQNLYVLGEVTTMSPTSNATRLQNFDNDSLSIFIDGPTPTSSYTASDHHITIDSAGQVADYMISARSGLAGITAIAGTPITTNGLLHFVVEAKVQASIFGRPTGLAKGNMVRVNFQINDAPDTMNHYRVWFLDAAACPKITGVCEAQGTSEPYCDPRCSGNVVLR